MEYDDDINLMKRMSGKITDSVNENDPVKQLFE